MNTEENQEIEAAIAKIKGETTDKLKQRLLECSAEVVALEHLLSNKNKSALPFPMPGDEAKEFRARVDHFIDGRLPVAKQIAELRQKQEQLKKGKEL